MAGAAGVPLIEGVDTRRLTRHLRERGAMRGVVAEGREPSRELTASCSASPSMEGLDLASRPPCGSVTRRRRSSYRGVRLRDEAEHRADAGRAGCRVTVVPGGDHRRREVRELKPDGLFLSQRPGRSGGGELRARHHSRACRRRAADIRHLPRASADRARLRWQTAKLPYGHRGGNHPVRDLAPVRCSSPPKTMDSR